MATFLLKKSYQLNNLKGIKFNDLWGDHGVFTTMWIFNTPFKILFFKDHIENLIKSAKVYGIKKNDLKKIIFKLLNNQEKEDRNIYTGSFGYIKFNGDMRFNIIIRSILNFKNTSEVAVASGVVIDSNANREFNENYIKAKALIDLY